jgi:hypothetical protein
VPFPVKLLIAMAVCVLMMRVGVSILRALATPNEPPAPGEMRKVNLRYRCSICGTEVRMTQANEELPDPPRHCLEDMDLVAPPFE